MFLLIHYYSTFPIFKMANPISYPDSRIVETSYGKIQGRKLIHEGEKQCEGFQGIPFAKPPVGALRFKRNIIQKPEAPERWEGVKETKKFGPRAIVGSYDGWDLEYDAGTPSEDCLYLNVFSPCWKAPQGGFPVMVWIHGGAFEVGDPMAYGDVNICENIVKRDVVFITIHYRVGYLGFFTTGDAACPGNAGLWDQVAALKWINENVAAFGGDKSNITVLGQSAGSVSVDMLHLSPHSTNLFHKRICMSGTVDSRWVVNKNMPIVCKAKAARLGVTEYGSNEEMLEKLRAIPAEKFGIMNMNREKEPDVDLETVTFLDGDFFPEPFDVLRAKATPKPLMIGVNNEEGLLCFMGKKPTTEAEVDEVITWAIHDAKDKQKLFDELKSLYFEGGLPEDKDVHDPVYLYTFKHNNPAIFGAVGTLLPLQDATHSTEMFYLFHKGLFGNPPLTDDDKYIMDLFTTTCTHFAKFGNPNGASNHGTDLPVQWKPLDSESHTRNFVFIADKPHMQEQFFEGRPARFAEIVKKHRAS
ncbi:hypothetical protein PRIPAC_77745 [Pristionchus pacificus]|uniref:Carboxylic ester hydrolase n=1 Tax=Pristionchus pacificus TaxID=54126 RepID=A0A2A6BY08_PRIPA|nr:hypothetical protein PRIPAC_77745 [Pristionchus pacificus]|eukprot:PDM70768.1 hydrolase [Pristionchus pacificus]